jgi:transposase
MQGEKPFQPKAFYSVNLDAMVPRDNFYRRLNTVLDLRWVRRETRQYYGTEGQKSIDPEVFMKMLLVGYLNNICSDRRLVETCSNRLDIRLFLGYDIDEELPWHSTISRTRQLWGEEVFLALFQRVLGMCVEKGMVRGKRQAMDAAPIKANASMDSLLEKEVEEDAAAYADELDAGSEHRVMRVEKSACASKGLGRAKVSVRGVVPTVDQYRKRRVEKHHEWKKEAYKGQPGHSKGTEKEAESDGKDENGNLIRGKYLSNHTHYSPTDPDARISVKPGKARQLNYHAQLAVDDGSHVITNALATHADLRDSQVLPTLIDGTDANLRQHGLVMEELSADTGYSSGEALRHCERKGLTAYIPNFGQYKHQREGFIYNEQENRYECQRGHRALLPFKRESVNHDGHRMYVYRSSSKDCRACPLRKDCIGKSDFKAITHSVDKALYDAMPERLQTPQAKAVMKRRSSTVEPVLGTLVNFTGMKRINARGIDAANKHVLMASIAYNLKKYLRTPWKNVKVIALALPRPEIPKNSGLLALFRDILTTLRPYRNDMGIFHLTVN